MGLQRHRLVRRADAFEEVAEALRPGNRRGPRRTGQKVRIDPLGELGEHRRHLIQSAGALFVADKIDRRRLDAGNQDRSARRVEALDRHLGNPFAGDEGDPDDAARYRPSITGESNLKCLRTVMRRAVILGGGQESRIVRSLQMLHERRDELVGRQTAETPVLGRQDDVEATGGTCHQSLFRQPAEREPGRGGGYAERGSHVGRAEVVSAIGGEPGDDIAGSGRSRIHARKVSLFDTFGKRFRDCPLSPAGSPEPSTELPGKVMHGFPGSASRPAPRGLGRHNPKSYSIRFGSGAFSGSGSRLLSGAPDGLSGISCRPRSPAFSRAGGLSAAAPIPLSAETRSPVAVSSLSRNALASSVTSSARCRARLIST